MPDSGDPLRGARAVVLSWHGVLFDRGRHAIHGAVRATFARWNIAITDEDLAHTRGPTGRAQIERLFSIPRIAESFRTQHRRWATADDLEAMQRDLEPRLLSAAAESPEPNADACAAIRRLRAQGKLTAVICCTPRRLLAPQLDALARANVPLDCIVTADEACEPAPAPWGIFETLQQLGIDRADELVLIDDSPAGPLAARNAGARSVGFGSMGPSVGDAVGAHATIQDLDELGRKEPPRPA